MFFLRGAVSPAVTLCFRAAFTRMQSAHGEGDAAALARELHGGGDLFQSRRNIRDDTAILMGFDDVEKRAVNGRR